MVIFQKLKIFKLLIAVKQQEIKDLYNECKSDGLIDEQTKPKSVLTKWMHYNKCTKTMSNFNTCLDNDLILENTPSHCWVNKYKEIDDTNESIEPKFEQYYDGDVLSPEYLMIVQKKEKCR